MCTGEVHTFPKTGPHKVPNALNRSQYGHRLWHDTHQDDIQILDRYWRAFHW